jgi:hypothetical protein
VKKFVYVIILGLAAFCAFGQGDEKPLVMYELGSGYSVGINTNNSVPLEFKMIIPFGNFGFMLSGGADFAESSGGHGFIGATYFVINNDKTRIPVSLGFSISGNEKHSYIGFSGLVSYQYILTNNIYIGFNMEMNNRRASPAVSLTFKLYSDKETAQAASPHISFGIPLISSPDS